MDLDKIKTLIDAMATSDLSELVLSEDGWTLRLVRASGRPFPNSKSESAKQFAAVAAASVANNSNATPDLKAPLSGVVYLAPAPDKPPFVTAGQAIKAGTPICVIEAMKVFNEVRAEADGTIESILVTSGHEVEAGQPLLRMLRAPA
jgi:acetyl-CoA carboxylase biotin carboxyl carrier protein